MQRRWKTIAAIGLAAAICAASAACSTSESNASLNQLALTASASTTSATSGASPYTAATSASSTTSSMPTPAASSSSPGLLVDYASKPEPADPTAAAVLKAYRDFSDVKVEMMNGAMYSARLKYVAAGKIVEDLTSGVDNLRAKEINFTGRPHSDPSVASVAGGKATVRDCFGGPDWVPVYSRGASKGESAAAPGSKLEAHVLTATLQKYGDKWLVTDALPQQEVC